MFNAFVKGLYFLPDASYTFGLILPMCSMLTTTLVVFGLLEVGDTILDPFGADPEDFTVLHFIEFTISSSLSATEVDSIGPPMRDRPPSGEDDGYYTPVQTMGALRFVSKMVARHRERKAKAQQLITASFQQALDSERDRSILPRLSADPTASPLPLRIPEDAESSSRTAKVRIAEEELESIRPSTDRQELREEAANDRDPWKERAPSARPRRSPRNGIPQPLVGTASLADDEDDEQYC